MKNEDDLKKNEKNEKNEDDHEKMKTTLKKTKTKNLIGCDIIVN